MTMSEGLLLTAAAGVVVHTQSIITKAGLGTDGIAPMLIFFKTCVVSPPTILVKLGIQRENECLVSNRILVDHSLQFPIWIFG